MHQYHVVHQTHILVHLCIRSTWSRSPRISMRCRLEPSRQPNSPQVIGVVDWRLGFFCARLLLAHCPLSTSSTTRMAASAPVKPDAFTRQGQAWFCTTELPSDLIVEVGHMSFHLHKFPLLSKSPVLEQLIQASSDQDKCIIKLGDIPGGAKTFEMVARFCYGMKIEISSANVVHLRCASEHLQMTEEISDENLIAHIEMFLNQVVLCNWKESLKALETCDDLLPYAEDLHIVKRCIESLASKATIDPNLFGWPTREHGIMQSPGGSVPRNRINTGARPRNFSSDWWYHDVSSLSFPMYKRLLSCMESRGIQPEIIAGSLVYYGRKYISGLRRRNMGTTLVPLAGTLSVIEQKNLLEEIDRVLPVQKGLVPTELLLRLLKTSMILKANSTCIYSLEKRVGMQLDQANLGDLLLPSYSYTMETLYNVECVQSILEHFLTMVQANGGWSPCMDDRIAITNVAKLIDGYLGEVAPDVNLKPLKFQALASALPEYARPLDDGLYHAIDVYLKAHSWLSEAEREQLCRPMNCQKLSLEACTHAAQNKRLPLRVVVQVLFFKQLQLRASIAGCLLLSDNLEGSGPLRSGGVAISDEAVGGNQVLKVDMDNMRMRLAELEKECSDMRQEIKKLGRGGKSGAGGGGWTSHLSRRFGLKEEAADVQHPERGSVSEQQKNMSSKLDKLEAKLSKQKRQLCADARN